jgi:hypothetical protein
LLGALAPPAAVAGNGDTLRLLGGSGSFLGALSPDPYLRLGNAIFFALDLPSREVWNGEVRIKELKLEKGRMSKDKEARGSLKRESTAGASPYGH